MQHSLHTKTLSNGIDVLFIDIPGVNSFDFVVAFNSGYRFATVDNIDKYEIYNNLILLATYQLLSN